jgi:hypothetical protein
MGRFIEESLNIAAEKFKKFGFSDIQIEQLLASGKRDLEGEVAKLEILLEDETPDIEKINKILHALKGLLYNMGNTEAGDKMADLKEGTGRPEQIEMIRNILKN